MRTSPFPTVVICVASLFVLRFPQAFPQAIDLGDVTAGGDGSGNAPAANTGIDPRNGRFTTGTIDGPLLESDPAGDGRNPSPGASPYVDSVFIIQGVPLPGAGLPQVITKSGLSFMFAFDDGAPAGEGTWNYILRDRNGGTSNPPVRVGGQEGFTSAVGIHSAAGITFDLDALRARHGADSVGCFSTFWGLGDCTAGLVKLYAILSSEAAGVITVRSASFAGGGGAFMEPLEIPPGARYLTLAVGASGGEVCDDGTFALPLIGSSPCLPPSFVTLHDVTPSVVSSDGGTSLLVTGEGFTATAMLMVGDALLQQPALIDSRRMQGVCPQRPPGLHDVVLLDAAGGPVARLPGALRVVGAATARTGFEESFTATDLTLETVRMKPLGSPATRVRLRGADTSGGVGFPILPCIHRVVVVPAGATVVGAALDGTPGPAFPGHASIEWSQSPQPSQESGHVPRPPENLQGPDGPTYFPPPPIAEPLHPFVSRSATWPPRPVVVEGTAEMGGYQIVRLAIFPVSWSPLKATITLLQSARVTLFHDGGSLPTSPAETYREFMEQDAVRKMAVNPNLLLQPAVRLRPPETLDAWYLIITDKQQWNENKTPIGFTDLGDMEGEFERLAKWKTQKGIKAAVVTVSDIVSGRYGNFKPGTRDLQELLRNFLKHARKNFGTYWVLLGGDTDIIPARKVVMHMGGAYTMPVLGNPKPENYQAYADSAGMSFRIHSTELSFGGSLEGLILDPDTNLFYRNKSNASPQNPGWYFATDDSYSAKSKSFEEFVVLYGPSTASPPSFLYQASSANQIPTDLYYASVDSPLYGQPGIHDWDANGNGLYGEYFGNEAADGVDFWPNLIVGRAPVAYASEARSWVDKLLAYEKYDGFPSDFGRKLLLGSTNWWGPPVVVAKGAKNPPEKGTYFSANGSSEAHLHFAGAPGGGYSLWDLIAYNSASDWWVVPFNDMPGAPQLGYYYADGPGYLTFSGIPPVLPFPTEFVRVAGPPSQVHPTEYFLDNKLADESALEKEEVKALFHSDYLAVDMPERHYQDFEDVPGFPQSDLFTIDESAMVAPITSGYNIVSLSGHGWWTGCVGVTTSNVNLLKNGLRCGIFYADSCLTGRFTETPNLAGELLSSQTGGGVGYVGNSSYGWIGSGHDYEMAFWRRLGLFRHLGWLQNTKVFLADNMYRKWANYSLNLMGCPEMPVWIGTPAALSAEYSACIQVGDSIHVTVRSGGQLVKGAIVCLTDDAGLFVPQATTATGETVFTGLALSPGQELTLTATFIGDVPYQGAIGVQTFTCTSVVYYPGDGNSDGKLDISDAVKILSFLFLGAAPPLCPASGDANGDGKVDISDPVRLLGYLFLGDPPPEGYVAGQPLACPTVGVPGG